MDWCSDPSRDQQSGPTRDSLESFVLFIGDHIQNNTTNDDGEEQGEKNGYGHRECLPEI